MIVALILSVAIMFAGFFYIKVPADKFKYKFISPLFLLPVFVILYMILGFEAYWKGRYSFLGSDFSSSLVYLYNITSIFEVLFFIFFVFFYYFFKNKESIKKFTDYQLRPVFLFIFVFLIIFYAILSMSGFRIPVLHNLIMIFLNSALVVVSYAYVSKVKGSLLLLVLFSSLIMYMGFRYRLIFLFLPIILYLFVFYKLSVYRLLKYFIIIFCSILLVALVGVTRKYGEGLQLERLEGMGFLDIIIKGFFNDTSTVLTSGAVVKWLNDTENFAYFNQVWYVINYFIPNELYPDKEYSTIYKYLSIVTGQLNNESGAAVLGFVEYYHTAGYYGIILFSILFSFYFSKFFRNITVTNSRYEYFQYFILLTWFLNSLTRGYFPQNIQDLISVLVGLYMIKKLSKAIHS